MNKKTYTAIRQTLFNGVVFLLLMQAGQTVSAAAGGVEYRVAWDASDERYHVYLRPTTTPAPDLSLTAQVTLRVPHATGSNQFKVEDIQSKTGTAWNLGSTVTAPPENRLYDYLSFIYNPVDVHAFAFKAGVEQEVFSFKSSSPCLGDVELMDNDTDPFNQPPANPANSAGTNPNNQFANAGWGATDDNDYLGNYGSPAACTSGCSNTPALPQADSVYYRTTWDKNDQRYHVFMYPGSVPARNMSLTSQVTLKVPHSGNADKFKVADLQSAISDVSWSESSRVDAPEEDNTADYLSFTMSLTNSQAFQWQDGKELEVFSFTNSGACLGPVALLKNDDPFNLLPNSVDTNPGNQFSNLGWGSADANNYAGNYGCPAVCLDLSLDSDNDGLTDGQENELGTDPNNPDTDTDTLEDGEEVRRGANPLKADVIRLQIRVMLQGAYDSNSKLMRDTLRSKGTLPLETPYQAPAVPETGSKTMASTILNTSGNNAPVDWVFVELRDPTTPTTVKARLTGLVQRDGDMVDPQTGENTFLLLGVEPGNYFVSAHHRNHLGAMGATALALGGTPVMVDFSQASTATYGDNARVMAAGTALLWAGNTNGDAQIISQGPANDSGSVLSNVLMTPDNSAYTTNYKLGGYLATDTNMDGISIFAGPSNDVDLLLGNVLLHPVNSTFSSNYIIRQQLP